MNFPKIIVRNKGGVGNQLFIYAFSKSLSLDLKGELLLDNYSGFKRDYYKRTNKLKHIIGSYSKEFKTINKYVYFILNNTPKPLLEFLGVIIIVDNPSKLFLLDNRKLKKYNLIFVDGYFQSYKYFSHRQNEIFNRQTIFKNFKLSSEYDIFKNKIQTKNSISIHIRKKEYSIAIDDSYYFKALSLMRNNNEAVFIFSDDINQCKKIFKGSEFIFVEAQEVDEIQELYLLSLFENQIISNSTFSYWGALLTLNTNVKIIAPKNPGIGVNDNFYPSSWTLI